MSYLNYRMPDTLMEGIRRLCPNNVRNREVIIDYDHEKVIVDYHIMRVIFSFREIIEVIPPKVLSQYERHIGKPLFPICPKNSKEKLKRPDPVSEKRKRILEKIRAFSKKPGV